MSFPPSASNSLGEKDVKKGGSGKEEQPDRDRRRILRNRVLLSLVDHTRAYSKATENGVLKKGETEHVERGRKGSTFAGTASQVDVLAGSAARGAVGGGGGGGGWGWGEGGGGGVWGGCGHASKKEGEPLRGTVLE